jgi:hypothetical protein
MRESSRTLSIDLTIRPRIHFASSWRPAPRRSVELEEQGLDRRAELVGDEGQELVARRDGGGQPVALLEELDHLRGDHGVAGTGHDPGDLGIRGLV